METRDYLAEALNINSSNFDDSAEYFTVFDPSISREEALKRNAEFVTCQCGVRGNRPNMMRWHFESCTTKLRQCMHCNSTIPRQGIKPYLYDQKKYCDRGCYMKSKIGKAPIIMTDEIKTKISVAAKLKSNDYSERMKKNKVWLKSNRWPK